MCWGRVSVGDGCLSRCGRGGFGLGWWLGVGVGVGRGGGVGSRDGPRVPAGVIVRGEIVRGVVLDSRWRTLRCVVWMQMYVLHRKSMCLYVCMYSYIVRAGQSYVPLPSQHHLPSHHHYRPLHAFFIIITPPPPIPSHTNPPARQSATYLTPLPRSPTHVTLTHSTHRSTGKQASQQATHQPPGLTNERTNEWARQRA